MTNLGTADPANRAPYEALLTAIADHPLSYITRWEIREAYKEARDGKLTKNQKDRVRLICQNLVDHRLIRPIGESGLVYCILDRPALRAIAEDRWAS